MYPRARQALEKFLIRDIIGLDYILTRDSANPFDIEKFKAVNPDIPQLIYFFENCNTLSLTGIDMLSQIKEAGMFDQVQDPSFHAFIEDVLSHSIRYEKYKNHRIIERRTHSLIKHI